MEARLQKPLAQRVARGWRPADLQLIDRLLREAAILEQVVAPLRSGRRREVLAEVGERQLVNLDERFALRRAFARLPVLDVRDRNAEARRQMAHRFLEADLLLQLDELEDVAADPAPEAVEEAAVAHDVERRRL